MPVTRNTPNQRITPAGEDNPMPITYGSVCSGIEAATQAWHPLGMRAAWFAEIESITSELEHEQKSAPAA